MADDTLLSPVASVHRFPLSLVRIAAGVYTCVAPLSLVAYVRCSFSSLFASASITSISPASGSDAPLSPIVSARRDTLFFFMTACGADDVSASTGDTSTSSAPLSSVASVGLLFSVPPSGSRALFLPSTSSYTRCLLLLSLLLFHSSLPFLPTLLARNQFLFTEKRSFDQAFIT